MSEEYLEPACLAARPSLHAFLEYDHGLGLFHSRMTALGVTVTACRTSAPVLACPLDAGGLNKEVSNDYTLNLMENRINTQRVQTVRQTRSS